MKRILGILLLLMISANCIAELHLAYTTARLNYEPRYRIVAQVRLHMLHKYGKDWFYENILRLRNIQTLEIRISNNNRLIINYKCLDDIVGLRDDYIEGIKFVIDSLAEINDTLFTEYLHPFGKPLLQGSFQDQMHEHMKYEAQTFFWGGRHWDYARIFAGYGEQNQYPEVMELFTIQALNMGAHMENLSWNKYFSECKELNIRPITNRTIYKIEYTEEEKDLFIKHICMNDVYILTHINYQYYVVPFTYQPHKKYYYFEVENRKEDMKIVE